MDATNRLNEYERNLNKYHILYHSNKYIFLERDVKKLGSTWFELHSKVRECKETATVTINNEMVAGSVRQTAF